jgi:predicted alpha/beta hydrolase family esterase
MTDDAELQFVMVPGLENSGPGHWQSLWQPALGASRVLQRDWSNPDLDRWADGVAGHMQQRRPAVLIAHSLGCLAVARAWPRIRRRVRAVLFVAPANPRYFGFSPVAHHIEVPSLLIASRNDLWLSFADAQRLAVLWGSELVDLGAVGHINVDSGHGHWPEGWELLDKLLARCGQPGLPVADPSEQARARSATCG